MLKILTITIAMTALCQPSVSSNTYSHFSEESYLEVEPVINNRNVCEHCTLKRIWDMYQDFTSNQCANTMVDISGKEDYRRLSETKSCEYDFPCILKKLTIDLPLEEIERIYNEFGVIQLRPVGTETKLLIGCGNSPIDPDFTDQHNHVGMITINPELSMNPTIVGAFGVHDLSKILPHKYYTALVEESVNPITDNKLKEALDFCCSENYKFYTVQKDNNNRPILNKYGEDFLEEIHSNTLEYLSDTNF